MIDVVFRCKLNETQVLTRVLLDVAWIGPSLCGGEFHSYSLTSK